MTKKKIRKLYDETDFEQWFEKIYEANFEAMYRYAFSMIKNRVLAEDIVMEVFLNIWNKKPCYEDIREVKAYLKVSVKNHALRLISRDADRFSFTDYKETLQISDDIDPESLLIGKELEQVVHETLDELPAHAKLVYELSREKGYSNQQIAEKLEISKRTVESHLFAVIKKIRSRITSHLNDPGKVIELKAAAN